MYLLNTVILLSAPLPKAPTFALKRLLLMVAPQPFYALWVLLSGEGDKSATGKIVLPDTGEHRVVWAFTFIY